MKKNYLITKHMLKLALKIRKDYLFLIILSATLSAIFPFINIIMPRFIINELFGNQNISKLIELIIITIIANLSIKALDRFINTKKELASKEIVLGIERLMAIKLTNLDYEKVEDPKIQDLKEAAIFPIRNQDAISVLFIKLTMILNNIITIIGTLAIIFTLDLVLIIVTLFLIFINSFFVKYSEKITRTFLQSIIPINRKAGYFFNLIFDFSFAKDLRLYKLSELVYQKYADFMNQVNNDFGLLYSKIARINVFQEIILQLQSLFAYAYLSYSLIREVITLGDFSMYISAVNTFSLSLTSLINNYIDFKSRCLYLEKYVEFNNIESINLKSNRLINSENDITIEFKNVAFKYPSTTNYTLKNINLIIKPNEKLSIVGMNGAGKTTFIKLLLRLYQPTNGEILLNNVNIQEYDYQTYLDLLSVVFQDFKLLAFSIKENIVLDENKDDEIVLDLLEQVGIDINNLPKGINTNIYKIFDEQGIEFSGGQSQKLAIARALYKDSPIVILDEPTAALDPIAEYEIYSKFDELVGNKTTIYISHRLSSCRFCDNIAVFKDGEIIQYGNHNNLIKDKENLYYSMFEAQAQYYR